MNATLLAVVRIAQLLGKAGMLAILMTTLAGPAYANGFTPPDNGGVGSSQTQGSGQSQSRGAGTRKADTEVEDEALDRLSGQID